MRVRLLLLLVLPLLAGMPACGGGGSSGSTGTIVAGPPLFQLPFPRGDSSAVLRAGFKNQIAIAATILVQAFEPDGTAYGLPVLETIPPFGEVNNPISVYTGPVLPVGGWLRVDTRDPGTLDGDGEPTPTSTTGFVTPYLQARDGIVGADAFPGLAFRSMEARAAITPQSDFVTLVNDSYLPGGLGSTPVAADFDVEIFDAFGDLATSATFTVPAEGSATIVPTVDAGQVVVRPTPFPQTAPAGTVFRFGASARDAFLSRTYANRYQFTSDPSDGLRQVCFDLEWGIETLAGGTNVFDFALVCSNFSGSSATVTVERIETNTGAVLLSSPRTITLDGNATKIEASRTIDSRGLQSGEQSVFQDIFGDVGLATGVTTFQARVSTSASIDVSARGYDSFFGSFYRFVPGRKTTTDVMVSNVPVQTTVGTGLRNWITFMNSTTSAKDVAVRGFTPGGTEYILPNIMVPAGTRFDWSPDGMIFREDPTDVTAPPVPFMSFRLSPTGGLWFDSRETSRNGSGLILFVQPGIVRDLRAD